MKWAVVKFRVGYGQWAHAGGPLERSEALKPPTVEVRTSTSEFQLAWTARERTVPGSPAQDILTGLSLRHLSVSPVGGSQLEDLGVNRTHGTVHWETCYGERHSYKSPTRPSALTYRLVGVTVWKASSVIICWFETECEDAYYPYFSSTSSTIWWINQLREAQFTVISSTSVYYSWA